MDFDCEQRDSVHFFYTLPLSKNKALVETTWITKMNDNSQKDYDRQINDYIEKNLKLVIIKLLTKKRGQFLYSIHSIKIKKIRLILELLVE
jgi:lycopene beta-cyclase